RGAGVRVIDRAQLAPPLLDLIDGAQQFAAVDLETQGARGGVDGAIHARGARRLGGLRAVGVNRDHAAALVRRLLARMGDQLVHVIASLLVTKILRSSRARSMIGGMKPSSSERSPWTGSPCIGSAATILTASPKASFRRLPVPINVPPVPSPATNADTSSSS